MLSFRKPSFPNSSLGTNLRWTAPLLLVALAGCSDGGPRVVPVTGTLTYKGKPVTNTYIDFIPENGRLSWALTDQEGHFKLNYDRHQDGAVVGKHKVSVRQRPATPKEQEAVMRGKKLPVSEFFNKYSAEKSTVEVVIDKNTRELRLDWD